MFSPQHARLEHQVPHHRHALIRRDRRPPFVVEALIVDAEATDTDGHVASSRFVHAAQHTSMSSRRQQLDRCGSASAFSGEDHHAPQCHQ